MQAEHRSIPLLYNNGKSLVFSDFSRCLHLLDSQHFKNSV